MLSFRYDGIFIKVSVFVSILCLLYASIWIRTFLTCFTPLSQELVSIGTEGRTGDLSVLGNIRHKMVCSPDFEALLESNA